MVSSVDQHVYFSAYLTHAIAFTDIRKQEEVLQESYMMIPDSKSRLEKVILELVGILVSSSLLYRLVYLK